MAKKRRKIEHIEDGQWVMPVMRNHLSLCCDCALAHSVDYKVVDGRVWYRASRDGIATSNARRGEKFNKLRKVLEQDR
jgi:hypothetical protein